MGNSIAEYIAFVLEGFYYVSASALSLLAIVSISKWRSEQIKLHRYKEISAHIEVLSECHEQLNVIRVSYSKVVPKAGMLVPSSEVVQEVLIEDRKVGEKLLYIFLKIDISILKIKFWEEELKSSEKHDKIKENLSNCISRHTALSNQLNYFYKKAPDEGGALNELSRTYEQFESRVIDTQKTIREVLADGASKI